MHQEIITIHQENDYIINIITTYARQQRINFVILLFIFHDLYVCVRHSVTQDCNYHHYSYPKADNYVTNEF